jgi:2'-5' RNA ligase
MAAAGQSDLFYVIAEPVLAEQDRAWIQSLRTQYDPQFSVIEPHFTLVFGTDLLPPDGLAAHVQEIARPSPSFDFELRFATHFPDLAASTHYVFLIPGKGSDAFAALHEHLHEEPLADLARSASTFTPHITIGRFAGAAEARALVGQLNDALSPIVGRISTLKVIAAGDRQVRTIGTIALGEG